MTRIRLERDGLAPVLLRRFGWSLASSALLLFETLLLLSPVVGGYFVPSFREPGMLGITLLDVLVDASLVLAVEMSLVGVVYGWVCAGYAPRGGYQQQERAEWRKRVTKMLALWCLVGVISMPFCLVVVFFVDVNNYPLSLLGPPLVALIGVGMSLRQIVRFSSYHRAELLR